MPEWMEWYVKLLDSLDSVVWYNGFGDGFSELYNQINDCSEVTFSRSDVKGGLKLDDQFEVLWMILVCMFGEYGTSPRWGWLDMSNREAILEFINRITATHHDSLLESTVIAENNFPVDFAPVIRCEECKYSDKSDCSAERNWCDMIMRYVNNDWFCADGKKDE